MSSAPLAGRTIGVLGLARSGLAAARLALSRGARVYASDAGDGAKAREAAEQVRSLGGDAETGGHDLAKLAACERVVLSPGIPPTAAVLRAPEIAGVPVIPEVEFAYGLMDAYYIAITGTNGKTTVTAMIGDLLVQAGMDAAVGGNIGTALSELALREPQPKVAVVEVSSFQLSGIRDFTPRIGILTNLAPDHLDWYPDVEAYYADKARLFRNASADSRWILNAEDERARDLIGDAPGTRYSFRARSQPSPDERGGWLSEDGWLTLRIDRDEERLVRADELKILGPHNVANALAASLAARLAGADSHSIARGLRTFEAPPHRLQPVAERGGVLWINDSKATNIASTRVAVRGMTRPTVLLLGGKHKGEPYTELLPDLGGGRVKAILAYGEAAPVIVGDLEGRAPVERVEGSFEEVVRRARETAAPGDAVLLSPACSSFDMFANYEERGKRFAELAAGGEA